MKFLAATALLPLVPSCAGGAPVPPVKPPDGGPDDFIDKEALAKLQDRDPSIRAPFVVDMQLHIWTSNTTKPRLSPIGADWLNRLANLRTGITGRTTRLIDMNRAMFVDDCFLKSETDIAVLNTFQWHPATGGVDMFPAKEAAELRAMLPDRVRVLGSAHPVDRVKAVEYTDYMCKELGIVGFKFYPPQDSDHRGYVLDDEQLTFPIVETLRKNGVKLITAHRGLPGGEYLDEYSTPDDAFRLAKAFPDIDVVLFHAGYPYDLRMMKLKQQYGVNNIHLELGFLSIMMIKTPARFALFLGRMLKAFGEDKILFGTDGPHTGAGQYQIEVFQMLTIPTWMQERYDVPPLTQQAKNKILGLNAAKLLGVDPAATRAKIEASDLGRMRAEWTTLRGADEIKNLRGKFNRITDRMVDFDAKQMEEKVPPRKKLP